MAEYHVGCGISGIYAGTLKPKKKDEWLNKSLVTDEAIEAVRDWLLSEIKEGEKRSGYRWMLKNGGTVELVVIVHEADKQNS